VFADARATLSGTAGWACPSCGHSAEASTRFCAQCGEQCLPLPRGAVWRRWLHTLRLLLSRPGQLTLDHAQGKRQPHVPPLSLFLAINVVFFVAQSLSGLNVLSIPLKAHLESQFYSSQAKPLLTQRAEQRKLTQERFADRFDLQQETLAKATVLAMVPLFAGMTALAFRTQGRPWSTQWTFGLHFYAWLLVLLTLTFSLLGPVLRLLKHWGWEADNAMFDNVFSSLEGLFIAVYLGLASARVFALRWWWAASGAVVLTFTVLGVLYLHRMAMLAITSFLV
jgi:uncharacterized membrane protein